MTRTVFSVDDAVPPRHLLPRGGDALHAHLHLLPWAPRVFIEAGDRHFHAFMLAREELVFDHHLSWEDQQIKRTPVIRPGFVYIAGYEDHPEIVKIGRTSKAPEERLAILSRRTSAPGPLRLLYAIQTPMMVDTEAALHRANRHARRKGEWFRLSPPALLGDVLGIASAHAALKTECRVWMSNLPLISSSTSDMELLRAAGLGLPPVTKSARRAA